jgi:inosine/xanthosine triphosphate pyrophosphatase family protein
MPLTLLIATTNSAKEKRLRRLCGSASLMLLGPENVAPVPVIDEDGNSHMGNAIRKAVGWSRVCDCATIASDGGLSIPAMGYDWESLLTRRGTGGEVSDAQHATRLLGRMRGLKGPNRNAHWTEGIAIARSGELLGSWEANGLHGHIAESYAPPANAVSGFWVSGLWQTVDGIRYGELSDAELAALGDPWAELSDPVQDMLRRLAG